MGFIVPSSLIVIKSTEYESAPMETGWGLEVSEVSERGMRRGSEVARGNGEKSQMTPLLTPPVLCHLSRNGNRSHYTITRYGYVASSNHSCFYGLMIQILSHIARNRIHENFGTVRSRPRIVAPRIPPLEGDL